MNRNNPPPLLAVRAFILNEDGDVLILKRAPCDEFGDLWCLPGGKVDFGQTAKEAIVREVQEETSLECISSLFLFYLDGLPVKPEDKHYLTLFFGCEVTGSLKLNSESALSVWIGQDDVGKYKYAFDSEKAIQSFWSK